MEFRLPRIPIRPLLIFLKVEDYYYGKDEYCEKRN